MCFVAIVWSWWIRCIRGGFGRADAELQPRCVRIVALLVAQPLAARHWRWRDGAARLVTLGVLRLGLIVGFVVGRAAVPRRGLRFRILPCCWLLKLAVVLLTWGREWWLEVVVQEVVYDCELAGSRLSEVH